MTPCGAFVLAGVALRFARRAAGVALVACAVFVVLVALHPFAPRLPRGVLQLTALDCGQGDALFLVLPDGDHDVAGCRRQPHAGSAGGWVPGPALGFGRGYCFTLPVVARHQEDRCGGAHPRRTRTTLGGLYAIFENFRVGEFWHAASAETPEFTELLDAVAEHGIPTRTLMAGDALSLGDASVRVLWPGPDPPSGRLSQNDESLVMRISAKGMNFLLPGDASKKAEEGILASQEPLASQMLKVAHHGSKSSSSAGVPGPSCAARGDHQHRGPRCWRLTECRDVGSFAKRRRPSFPHRH